MISLSLGILALAAGARGYPLLLIVTGGIVLALLCFRRDGNSAPSSCARRHSDFAMPPVGACPPERLREARDLAARVIKASNERGTPQRRDP
ncbi:hypothetical protein B8W73_17625 [Arthrobacter agilis]|nr:hypothetical protein B8W73_17625 [Arthrobacter agilis]